jgi:hypothetical protein
MAMVSVMTNKEHAMPIPIADETNRQTAIVFGKEKKKLVVVVGGIAQQSSSP